jgi:hypothetical protein
MSRGFEDCAHPSRHQHGTEAGYVNHRCRCADCTAAHTQTARDRRRRIAYGRHVPRSIPSTGTRRRVEALACLGWSMQALDERMGWSSGRFRVILELQDGIGPATAQRVADLYEELWNQPAPAVDWGSRISVTRTRRLAERRGYLPSLAWDDIDHDSAPPSYEGEPIIDELAVDLACAGQRVPLTKPERYEVIRILHARGLTDREIGDRLGQTRDGIAKHRERHLVGAA